MKTIQDRLLDLEFRVKELEEAVGITPPNLAPSSTGFDVHVELPQPKQPINFKAPSNLVVAAHPLPKYKDKPVLYYAGRAGKRGSPTRRPVWTTELTQAVKMSRGNAVRAMQANKPPEGYKSPAEVISLEA